MPKKPLKTISEIPSLMLEWSKDDNRDLDPTQIGIGSHQKVWWKCSRCGRKWQSIVSNRARLGRSCPFCTHQRVVPGESDLETVCPSLALEWDKEKNGILASEVNAGSHRKAWWKCKKGHVWKAVIKARVAGVGCPVCSNKKIVSGINDLATTHPAEARMWHPTKNGSLMPQMVSHGSGKVVWWIDEYGNEFKASVSDVTTQKKKTVGPPVLRTSFEEQAVYFYIKKRFPDAVNGYKEIFRHGMELDVFVPSLKFGIEYDGKAWHQNRGLDREKKKYEICKRNGIKLIRIKENREHWKESLGLADYIVRTIAGDFWYLERAIRVCLSIMGDIDFGSMFSTSNITHVTNTTSLLESQSLWPNVSLASSLWKEMKGPDVSVDIDIRRDKKEIQKYLRSKTASLAKKFPEIASEWAYDLNDPLKPEQFHFGSNEKVWWRCRKCGHVWRTSISERTGSDKTGCKLCSRIEGGKKKTAFTVKQRGSFAKNHPDLLDEWDSEKNKGIDPNAVPDTSTLRVWWTCKRCGNSWQNTIFHRSKGEKCPYCLNKKIKAGFNDLATLFPEVALDWDFESNDGLSPTKIAPKSGKKINWVCHICGHRWRTSVSARTYMQSGCPNCWHIRRKKKK